MDFDEQLRSGVKRLAAPRPVPEQMLVAYGGQPQPSPRPRRRFVVGVTVVAAVLAVVIGVPLVVSMLHDGPSSLFGPTGEGWAVRTPPGISGHPYVSSYGIRNEVLATFDQPRTITSARVIGVRSSFVDLDPRTVYKDAGYPLPLKIKTHAEFSIEGTVIPDCTRTVSSVPRFVLISRSTDGAMYRNTVAVTDPHHWSRAVSQWCARGLIAHLHESSTQVNGDQKRVITLINPGGEPVTVTSASTLHQRRGWRPATITVPPAATRNLTITGRDSRGLPVPPLKADGKTVHLTQ